MTFAIPAERQGRAAPPDLAERRAQMGAAIATGAFATKAPPREEPLGGLRCLRFDPPGKPRAHMLQLHGGGFRIGRPEFEGPLCEALVERCGVAVAVPQYRLAPEAPFPAALNDALAALGALAAEAGGGPLILSGDSAGAGLAASLALLSAAGQAPAIDALVLLSPWLDLTVTASSYATNADHDALFSTESAGVAAELYLQGHDPRDPLASPLLADVVPVVPTLVSVGTREVLYDDSTAYASRLEGAGTPVELCAVHGMSHVAVVRDMALPGAAETFEAICRFVSRAIEHAGPPPERI